MTEIFGFRISQRLRGKLQSPCIPTVSARSARTCWLPNTMQFHQFEARHAAALFGGRKPHQPPRLLMYAMWLPCALAGTGML